MSDSLVFGIDRQVSRYNTDEWRRRQMTIQELMDRNYEQGLEQGEEKGRNDMKTELARAMKAEGEPEERIAKYTGLSTEEIKKM